jgi:hypothetical protein
MLIVTYHALGSPRSPISVSAAQLARDIEALTDAGFAFVSLDQCAEWLEAGHEVPSHAVALTFDDGYASVAREGPAVLARRRVPATVFVIAGRIGADNRWPGQSRHVRTMPLAGRDEIRALLDAGVTIGSHSHSHPTLNALDPTELRREVVESADRLEAIIGTPVRHFSYPYGRRSARVIEAVRSRYRSAVTADACLVTREADPHELPRIDAHDLHIAARLGLLGSHMVPSYLAVRRGARRVRRFAERFTGGGWEGLR